MKVLQAAEWDVLPRNECIVGLRSQQVGRIALSADALPVVLPVYFVYDESEIVFRTRSGSLLDRNCRNTVVAFEVDSHDVGRKSGWSVMAVGLANVLGDSDTTRQHSARLDRIGAPQGDVLIGVDLGSLSGRALVQGPAVVVTDA